LKVVKDALDRGSIPLWSTRKHIGSGTGWGLPVKYSPSDRVNSNMLPNGPAMVSTAYVMNNWRIGKAKAVGLRLLSRRSKQVNANDERFALAA